VRVPRPGSPRSLWCACGITVKWERQPTVVDRRSGLAPLRVRGVSLPPPPSRLPSLDSLAPSLSLSRGRLGYSRHSRRVRVREPRTVLRWLRCDERPRQETRGRSCIQGEYQSPRVPLALGEFIAIDTATIADRVAARDENGGPSLTTSLRPVYSRVRRILHIPSPLYKTPLLSFRDIYVRIC